MHKLGQELRKKRKEKGWTQAELANKALVHRTTYVKYERGVTEPSLEVLCRLADILNTTIDALLGRE